MFYRTAELLFNEVLHCENKKFCTFCSCDPITFIYNLDLYRMKMYPQTKNELSTSRLLKVTVLHTCIHTNIDTCYATEYITLQVVNIIKINVKNEVYKKGYRRRSCTSKTAKIHCFVRFVMYCFITTVPVAFCCARSDEIVHYKSDETVNFCGFRCATTSPITVFINFVFLHLYLPFFISLCQNKMPATFRNLPRQSNSMFIFLLTWLLLHFYVSQNSRTTRYWFYR